MSVDIIRSKFISKENVLTIYRNLLRENNITSIEGPNKKKILNQLTIIMKSMITNIDMTKVNNNNVGHLTVQFNNLCLRELSAFVRKNIKLMNSKKEQDSRHNNRTFQSIQPHNPTISHRPFAAREPMDIQQKMKQMEEMRKGNNINSNINNPYQPTPVITQNEEFSRTDNMSLMERMAELEKSRSGGNSNNRPPTPDFLKPMAVGNKQPSVSAPSSGPSQGFSGFDNDMTQVSVKFDTDMSKYDESISIEERMKQMEAERSGTVLPPQQSSQQPPQQPQQELSLEEKLKQMEAMRSNNVFEPVPPPQQQPVQQEIPQQYLSIQQPAQNIQQNNTEYFEHLINEIGMLKEQLYNRDNSMDKYNYLQLEMNKKECEYVYKFRPIHNIMGVKLLSYSLPEPSYNFEKGILMYKINNKNYQINIEQGYYNNDTLIQMLNKNDHLFFSINYKKRLEISLKTNNIVSNNDLIELTNFELIPTKLSKKLGFVEIMSKNNVVKAQYIVDFRLPTKLKLFIYNIDSNKPFGLLNMNGTSYCEFNFNQPKTLDNLHIVFKTEDGNTYDFDNMMYNLSFQLRTL